MWHKPLALKRIFLANYFAAFSSLEPCAQTQTLIFPSLVILWRKARTTEIVNTLQILDLGLFFSKVNTTGENLQVVCTASSPPAYRQKDYRSHLGRLYSIQLKGSGLHADQIKDRPSL